MTQSRSFCTLILAYLVCSTSEHYIPKIESNPVQINTYVNQAK